MTTTTSRPMTFRLLAAVLLLVVATIVTLDASTGADEAQANGTQLPSNPNLAALVSLGNGHACYIVNGGEVKCWGFNTSGQVGDGTLTNVTLGTETPVSGITTAVALTTSVHQTCALLADGTIRCWGRRLSGALGSNPSTGNSTIAATVTGITDAVEVELRSGGGCALTSTQEVWCWGDNSLGAVGDGTTTHRATPVKVTGLTDPMRLGSGLAARVSCAITEGPTTGDDDNPLWCWGNDQNGQLTDGSLAAPTYSASPQQIMRDGSTPLAGVVSVAVGGNSTCALLFDGTVWCWGHRNGGRVGNGAPTGGTDYSLYPVQVALGAGTPLTNAVSLSTHDGGVCAATLTNGTRNQYCWGVMFDLAAVASATPVTRVTTSAVAHIMAGYSIQQFSGLGVNWCAIMDGSSLVCEGRPSPAGPALVESNLSGATPSARLRTVQTTTGIAGCPIAPQPPVASNFGGTVSYASTSGTTPSGIVLDPTTGIFSGSTSAVGISSVSLSATGQTSGSVTATVTFSVTDAAMTLAPTTQTRTGTVSTAITATAGLTATNPCGSVTYSVPPGSLPAGLSMNASTGAITGTPTEGSTAAVTITATDSIGRTATSTVNLNIPESSSTPPALVLPLEPSNPTTQPAPTTTSPTTTVPAPTASTTPTTTAPPTPAPTANGALPSLAPGETLVTERGRHVNVELVVENDEALVLRSQDFELRLRGSCTDGCSITQDAAGRETIELERNGSAVVSGFGFLPGSQVHVWMFSEPRYLGALDVAADGTYAGSFPLADIEAGQHTLQANGLSADNQPRSANLGVVVVDNNVPTPGPTALPATGTSTGSNGMLGALALIAAGLALITPARRRRSMID